jgi:hypothetical protein
MDRKKQTNKEREGKMYRKKDWKLKTKRKTERRKKVYVTGF